MQQNPPKHSVYKGNLVPVSYKLPRSTADEMLAVLGLSANDPGGKWFLKWVRYELGKYLIHAEEQDETPRPSDDLKQIRKLSRTASQLRSQLESLSDHNRTIMHLLLTEQPGYDRSTRSLIRHHPVEELQGSLSRFAIILDGMSEHYRQTNKSGAPPKTIRNQLIDGIVTSYLSCFGSLPSSATDSPFEQALRICLEQVEIVISDLHSEIVASRRRVRGKISSKLT